MVAEDNKKELQQGARYLTRSLENDSHWHVWDDKHFVTFTGDDSEAVFRGAMWAIEHLDELMQKAAPVKKSVMPNLRSDQDSRG